MKKIKKKMYWIRKKLFSNFNYSNLSHSVQNKIRIFKEQIANTLVSSEML